MTVNEAISKGLNKIIKPMLPFFLITNGTSFFVSYKLMNPLIQFIVLAITILLCLLWWGISITKWRIWAFGNCRNVHELKRKAIKHKLIAPDGSILERFEIRSKKQIEQLKNLNKKFEIEDTLEEIKDDKSIEKETKIYYSKLVFAYELIIAIMPFAIGLYFLYNEDLLGFSLFISPGIVIAYFMYKKNYFEEAYIILNSRGIKTLKTPLTPWGNIDYIYTKREGTGKYEQWYLEFKLKNSVSKNKLNKIRITNLDKNPFAIEELISLYMQRNRLENS